MLHIKKSINVKYMNIYTRWHLPEETTTYF